MILTSMNIPFQTSYYSETTSLVYDVFIPDKKLALNFLNPGEVAFNLDKNQAEANSLIRFSSNIGSQYGEDDNKIIPLNTKSTLENLKKGDSKDKSKNKRNFKEKDIASQVREEYKNLSEQNDNWDFEELHK